MTRTEMLEAMHECIEWAEAYEVEAYDPDGIADMVEVAEAEAMEMMGWEADDVF